jgi:hypothetical protein
MDVEAGMTPRHDELDNHLRDLPFPQKDPQHFVLKDLFQGLRVQRRGHLERSASLESAIGAEYVAMGVEIQEIPKAVLLLGSVLWLFPDKFDAVAGISTGRYVVP